jgi:2-polyprenyl-3-methyl-5-hydroxy-6-metoxy-1,4-benzoquinol methylase
MGEREKPERADFSQPGHEGYFGDHTARYEFVSHFVTNKRVIDAACGTGYGTLRLKLAGASACLGIDLDGTIVARNQAMFGPQKVEYLEANCETFDYVAWRPDVVASFETLEHVQNPSKFVGAVAGAMQAGGVFIVSCPNDEELGDNPYHLHSWNASELRAFLGEYFEDVVVLGQVLTPAAMANAEFGRYIDMRLGVLWNQPWTRVWRGVRRLLGREAVPPRPDWCNIMATQHDSWFIPDTGSNAICLLAVCRDARCGDTDGGSACT